MTKEENEDSVESRAGNGILSAILILTICFLGGIVFGFASEKGRVFEPRSIRLQMVFERWIMLKMFLGAMGAGMFWLALMSVIPIGFIRNRFSAALAAYESTAVQKNILAVALGSFILGIGMALAGACPGMVLPQTGAWARQSIITLIGALIGALVYGLIHDSFYEKLFPNGKCVLPTTVTKLTKIKYAFVAFPMAVAVFGVVLALELVVPWKEDFNFRELYHKTSYIKADATTGTLYQDAPSIFQLVAWPPSICGVLIGTMQITIVLMASDTLGGSSSYCTIVSQWLLTEKLRSTFPYLAKFRKGIGNWWQVFYVVGAVVGGAISAAASETIGDVPGVPIVYAFFGGFFLLFGARLGSGCTSGHGLSGSGLLFLSAFVAVPCMFGGGIAVGFIMRATGALYEYESVV